MKETFSNVNSFYPISEGSKVNKQIKMHGPLILILTGFKLLSKIENSISLSNLGIKKIASISNYSKVYISWDFIFLLRNFYNASFEGHSD